MTVRLYSVSRSVAAFNRQLMQDFSSDAIDSMSVLRINKQFNDTGSGLLKASLGRVRTARTEEKREGFGFAAIEHEYPDIDQMYVYRHEYQPVISAKDPT